MGFYDLPKEKRKEIVQEIENNIKNEFKENIIRDTGFILKYVSDDDIYICKNAYLAIGRIYKSSKDYRETILDILDFLFQNKDEKVRQTVVYAWGEIGKIDDKKIMENLEYALQDKNPKVKNAIIGALKQMGDKNPVPTLKFAQKYINHPQADIRRQIIHGIELRGRTHPEDVLPLLEQVQNEKVKRVRDMLIHVIGQISYKKGCLERVVSSLKNWENKELVEEALSEILNVHRKYKFSYYSPDEARKYIQKEFS